MKKTIGLLLLTLLAPWTPRPAAAGASSLLITEFMAANDSILADGNGDYSDWIEIYNPTGAAVSVSGLYLTDDQSNLTKWQFPTSKTISVPALGYLVVMASGNADGTTAYIDSKGYVHTSFKLSASGEDMLLVAADGTTVISSYLSYPEQGSDVAYGKGSNGIIGYLRTPTPGAANGTATTNGWVADTKWSVRRGFYSSPFTVAITCSTEGATIKYTTDCSSPGETNGTVYSGPITVSGTTIIRAMAYKSGWISTDIDSQTYIFISNVIAQPATKPTSSWPDPTSSSGGGPGGGSTSKQVMDYGMDTKVTNSSTYSGLMDDALLALPTISIVTDLTNLFNTSTGIYANPTSDLECPASIEMFKPDGTDCFHVNTGLKIRGATTSTKSNPKHSFRIIMRSDYGDDKIEYPMFGADGADKFDKMDFRTAQNFSWHLTSPAYATWLDDPFSRDTMRDMGHPYTRGFFFHLYLDGLYWGLYQTEERPEAYFAQSYLGGASEDYDAIKADSDTGVMYATDGTMTNYNNYWTQVNAGVTTAAAYFKLQGLSADGVTTNTSYTRYLDVDNLIDYMLIVFFTGAEDMPLGPPNSNSKPRNLNIVGSNVQLDGFKYLPHDNEWSLMQQSPGVSINRVTASLGSTLGQQTYFNPWWLHSKLKSNAEYVLHFADRVHKHFFNGGALTASACQARYQTRIDEIDTAIIAESARWGDYLSASSARTRNTDWLPAVTWVRDTYLAQRTAIVLGQLQSAGLYPTVAAPEFSRNGGQISSGFSLTITAAAGTIYYTTDGSDPRLVGGSVSSAAASGSSGLALTLTASKKIKARALSGSVWSALTEADFTVKTGHEAPLWVHYF